MLSFFYESSTSVIQLSRIMNCQLTLRKSRFILHWGFLSKALKIPLGLLDLRLNEKLKFISLVPKPPWKTQTLHICHCFAQCNT